jgi:hypothetical protein
MRGNLHRWIGDGSVGFGVGSVGIWDRIIELALLTMLVAFGGIQLSSMIDKARLPKDKQK